MGQNNQENNLKEVSENLVHVFQVPRLTVFLSDSYCYAKNHDPKQLGNDLFHIIAYNPSSRKSGQELKARAEAESMEEY